ncbi:MAG: HAD family hydrolase [Neomegalonema sp.]|nr:HAD family hydrolase [Neomegalonema sp.]
MRIAQNLTNPALILATDLDGTFLGGSDAERRALYDWIEGNRASVGLIFVTGRDLPFISELCAGGVPWPDYVIGDVGTTIARVDPQSRAITPDAALEAPIRQAWHDRGEWVREMLADAPGLRLQPTPFRHRVSYDYDPAAFDPDSIAPIRAEGLDCLISDNRFLDVLPPGVSKGPSLTRLITDIEANADRVLVAGDTLNDYSMFETGFAGVAVGNSEPALREKVAAKSHVHKAKAHGAAGIWEAILAHQFISGAET